jgi:hypothetical protein
VEFVEPPRRRVEAAVVIETVVGAGHPLSIEDVERSGRPAPDQAAQLLGLTVGRRQEGLLHAKQRGAPEGAEEQQGQACAVE